MSAPKASVRYLERAQNRDGGFGPAPGTGSTQMHTGWAAIGLAAAGRNPRDLDHDTLAYIRSHADALRGDLGERSRTILAMRAAGVRSFTAGGRDLVAEIERAQEADGSWQGFVNTTAFAILALRAAGHGKDSRAEGEEKEVAGNVAELVVQRNAIGDIDEGSRRAEAGRGHQGGGGAEELSPVVRHGGLSG